MSPESIQLIAEDDLRCRVNELAPELRRGTERLADLLRESIDFDRAQFKPGGRSPTREELATWARSEARLYNDPTFTDWLAAYRAGRIGKGRITLKANKAKKSSAEPDFIGEGYAETHTYKAAAWIKGDIIAIALTREQGDA